MKPISPHIEEKTDSFMEEAQTQHRFHHNNHMLMLSEQNMMLSAMKCCMHYPISFGFFIFSWWGVSLDSPTVLALLSLSHFIAQPCKSASVADQRHREPYTESHLILTGCGIKSMM